MSAAAGKETDTTVICRSVNETLESITDRAGALEAIALVMAAEDGGEYFTRLNREIRANLLAHIGRVAESIAKDAQAAIDMRGAA